MSKGKIDQDPASPINLDEKWETHKNLFEPEELRHFQPTT